MRRVLNLLLACLLCLALPSPGLCAAEQAADTAVFPASLLSLESEALAGTAIRAAVFPEGFLSIGDGAFRDARELTAVYLPASTREISASAFPQNSAFCIHGAENSYAQTWAEEHSVAFVPRERGPQEAPGAASPDIRALPKPRHRQPRGGEGLPRLHPRGADEGKSMRPQERPELHPIDWRFP